MDDLVQFLRDRLDEDDHGARTAAELQEAEWRCPSTGVVDFGSDLLATGDRDVAYHIVRHDPARVLAEVEAKRQLVDKYVEVADNDVNEVEYANGWANALGEAVRLLALPYADHPEFKPEWRP